MARHVVVSLVLVTIASSCQAVITVGPLSSVYLPYSLEGGVPKYAMGDRGAVEKFSYDPKEHWVYTAGVAGILNVIDITNPSEPSFVHQQQLPGGVSDIDLCSDYVAVIIPGESVEINGRVLVYRKHRDGQASMELMHELPVGSVPDTVKFTKDCTSLVVANEGKSGEDSSGNFTDPEGSVTVIGFGSADIGSVTNPDVQTVDFRKFDDQAEFYHFSGVRWLFKDLVLSADADTIPSVITSSSFHQTLEPEYITFNGDDSKAYICLQENNAIAVLDMATATFDNIYPLGAKYWGASSLDGSDEDGGINFRTWPIYGLRQPDAIQYFTHNDEGYILTADEGDITDTYYTGVEYEDGLKGKQIYKNDLLSQNFPSQRLREALEKDSDLGCLRFSSVDGLDPTEPSKLYKPHTFGGRGVSVFRADDLSLVWDSGDDFERKEAEFYPEIFNSIYKDAKGPTDMFDNRSCKKGPEPQSVAVGQMGEQTLLFASASKTGTIFVYSLGNRKEMAPVFESVYWQGRTDLTWDEAYQARQVGNTDVEDMRFIPTEDSPNGRPLLLVCGTSSGTVSVFEVRSEQIAAASKDEVSLWLLLAAIVCLQLITG